MLVRAIKLGDQQAFEKTYLDWHAKVYAYFMHKTSSVYMAEELTQLTFIKLWNARHTLKLALPLQAQLFTIARTTMIDFLRKQANQQRLVKEAALELKALKEPIWDLPGKSRADFLINSLPPIRRQVFLLNRYEGYSNPEIAEKLDISVRTVEKHISLALKQLKNKLLPLLFFLSHYVYWFFQT